MAHVLVFGSCAPCTPGGDLLAALRRLAHDPDHAPLDRVSYVDLGRSPRLTRWRSAVGIGWHGAEWRNRVERDTGVRVDAVVEIGDCGPRHVMSLGRMGVPAVRWSFLSPTESNDLWLEHQAAAEGAAVLFAHPDRADAWKAHGDAWLPFAVDLDRLREVVATGNGPPVLAAPAPSEVWKEAAAARFGPLDEPPSDPCARPAALARASLVLHLDPLRASSDVLFEALALGGRVVTTPIGPRLGRFFSPGQHLDEVSSIADIGRLPDMDAQTLGQRAVRLRAMVAAAHTYEHRVEALLDRLLA